MAESDPSATSEEVRIDLFLCYSRRDLEYVRALAKGIVRAGLSVWVDLNDIPPADPDWTAAVDAGIVASPAFVFILSPDSLASRQCRRELSIAVKNRKQLIVIRHRPLADKLTSRAIKKSNWIAGESSRSVGTTAIRVVEAFSTDLAWKRYRAELDVAATRWRDRDRDQSYLLRGGQLSQAETELAAHTNGELAASRLDQDFVEASREAERTAERRRADGNRVAVATDWISRDPTKAALVLLELDDPNATAFAVERMNEVLRDPIVVSELHATNRLSAIAFSPDGIRFATTSESGAVQVWSLAGNRPLVAMEGTSHLDYAVFAANGEQLITAGSYGDIQVRPADGSAPPVTLGVRDGNPSPSPDGRGVVVGWEDGRARLYTGPGYVRRVDFIPDPLFSGDPDESGLLTKPEWLHPREPARGAPGLVLGSAPNWYSDRLRGQAFSPQGDRIVVGSIDGTARIWRIDAPSEPIVFHHDDAVLSVAFSADGRRIAVATYGGAVALWQSDGSGDRVALVHKAPVYRAVFSPDGSKVLTCCADRRIRVWPADGTGDPDVYPQDEMATSACFSPDGSRVLVSTGTRTVRVMGSDGLGEPRSVVHGANVRATAFDPDGQGIATASADGVVRFWSIRPLVFRHFAPVRSAVIGPSGVDIATVTDDNVVHVWRADRHAVPIEMRHDANVSGLAFSPDGRYIATASQDRTARLAPLDRSAAPTVLLHDAPVDEIAFSPDSRMVATACGDGQARVWRVDRTAEPVVLGPPGGYKSTLEVKSLQFNRDGSRILGASGPAIRIWPADGSAPAISIAARHYGGYIERVGQTAFTADGRGVISVIDGTVRIWSSFNASEPVTIESGAQVDGVLLSQDRRWMAAVSNNGTARVWNLGSFEELPRIEHGGRIEFVAFSPLGNRLAISNGGPTMRVWSLTTNRSVRLWHEGNIRSVAFSADGDRVVSVAEDGSARAWRTEADSDPLIVWHEGPVRSVAFSPNGEFIVTASDDRTASLWWLSGESLTRELRAATRLCLDADFLERFLGFDRDAAQAKYEACERAAGRLT